MNGVETLTKVKISFVHFSICSLTLTYFDELLNSVEDTNLVSFYQIQYWYYLLSLMIEAILLIMSKILLCFDTFEYSVKKLSNMVSAPRIAFEESVKVKLSNRINAIIEPKLYTKRDRASKFFRLNLFFWLASIPRMVKPLFNSTKSCIVIKLRFENEWTDLNWNAFYIGDTV